MDLKDFLCLLLKEKKLLLATITLFVAGTFLWQGVQPTSYQTVVSLHIARSSEQAQQAGEYQYGDYYRLQADEKFADTVVRWLLSPGIVLDILKESNDASRAVRYEELSQQFQPKRLSSQFIEVRFSTPTPEMGKSITDGMRAVLNKETKGLNVDSSVKENGWFVVLVDAPVTYLSVPNWRTSLLFSGALGLLVGIWISLGKRYFMGDENLKSKISSSK